MSRVNQVQLRKLLTAVACSTSCWYVDSLFPTKHHAIQYGQERTSPPRGGASRWWRVLQLYTTVNTVSFCALLVSEKSCVIPSRPQEWGC